MGQALRIIEGSRRTWAGLGQDGLYVPAAIRCKPPTGIPPTMHPTKTLRQLPPWRRWLTAQQPVPRRSGSATRMVRS